ncbi:MAG: hypothetical protein AAFX04_04155 [Pseudomonadota bacterium]
MMRGMIAIAMAGALMVTPVMVQAGWRLIEKDVPVEVAKKKMTVTPAQQWNRWTRRPGKRVEVWTLDGTGLNEVAFFGGVQEGEPIFKERQKKTKPLPKFTGDMLLTDLVDLYESSSRIVLDTALFEVDNIEPAKLSGNDAVRFNFHYTIRGDELRRNGEAVATIIDGELYMVTYVAPVIHYYDRDIETFRDLVETVKI